MGSNCERCNEPAEAPISGYCRECYFSMSGGITYGPISGVPE